jgi:hypothetical protein
MLPGSRKATTWKKGSNRSQASIPRTNLVAALLLETFQKVDNRRCIQIVHTQGEWLFAGFLLQELQQQPERIAVGNDRPRTDLLV